MHTHLLNTKSVQLLGSLSIGREISRLEKANKFLAYSFCSDGSCRGDCVGSCEGTARGDYGSECRDGSCRGDCVGGCEGTAAGHNW